MHYHSLLSLLSLALQIHADLPPRDQVGIRGIRHRFEDDSPDGPRPSETSAPGDTFAESALATGGTGCSTGTVAPIFADDRSSLTLIFNDLIADIGPNVPLQRSRRHCNVVVAMQVPAGWTFEVAEVNWRGFVDVDKGVRGVLAGQWYWDGERQRGRGDMVVIKKIVDGPFSGSYLKNKSEEKNRSGVFMACTTKDVSLNINTVVRLQYGKDGRGGGGNGNGGNNNGAKGAGGAGTAAANTAKGSITVDSVDARFKQELKLNWKRC
ncbi:hypothetical protein E2P81_ATG01395 [Venturia nashicola]|uniref:Gb n=1 Tax=Venturia nashicola TaxID=86259 RepID=A0A4Z1PGY8_9PEZI|nr:hypothetical protein E6O75_ATG01427 [Venturia nashicola]TLD38852.1 hypothetical protein E2P81_ATG01395 [Venturia nashicola]